LRDDEELPLYEAYVRHFLRRWRQQAPEDSRMVRRIALVRRRVYFPQPHEDRGAFQEGEEAVLGVFDPEGHVQ
jgi:hypothetical protein